MKQLNPSTLRRSLRTLFLAVILAASVVRLSAQCTGCTQTVSNNTAVTVAAGQVVCITFAGTYNKVITFNGGTLCISPATTVSSAISMPSGSALSIYGSYTGAMTQNGGAITAYSGGTFHPASFTVNGGSLTIASGGSATLATPTFPSGYTLTNSGAITIAGFTVNSGATVTLTGTSQTISNSVTNNGTLSITGPTTISGAFSQNSSGAATFVSGVTVTGSVSNNGTINLNGSFAVGGSYSSNSPATIKATGSGICNSVSVTGTISGTGTFDGNSNNMTISPTPACCMSNGATAAPSTPTQQPTATSGSISGNTVSGSFTAPSASIGGYIVLRYIGTAAPSCNPVNGTAYNVGDAIGTCTVAALVTGGSTGTKNFTDNLPPATTNCGKNVYYRIFSYNGSGACTAFYLTSPLTGSLPIPAFTATVTAGGATTFCPGGSVSLTATAGSSYIWSTTETTQAITASAAGTYTVTVTSAMGCTATASKAVTISAAPSPTVNSPTVCSGATATLTATGGGSYLWSTGATTAAITTTTAGTYTVTVTNAATCTASVSGTVTVNALPTASISASGATTFCTGGSVTLTASGGSTYLWSTGSTSSFIGASTSGTYTVTVTNASGCTATASKVVNVNTNPTATITASGSTTICSGNSVTLTASGGTTYTWSTTATTAAISATAAGAYTVTVTNASGCTASTSSTVTVHTLPTVTVSSNTPVCVGTSITLTAAGSGATSYTYSWSGPSSYTGSGSPVTIANATTVNGGNYNVTVTDNNTCTATATTAVTVDPDCIDSTTTGANGGNSSDAPCTQILRFDHYNDVVAGSVGQNHTWILTGGNKLSMTITRTVGSFTSVAAPTWSGAAFGQSGYTGLAGKTVLYTVNSGLSKVVFSNIQMKDSNGNAINNFTLIGIDAESTDNAERDTIISNGTSWFDYDTITPPYIGSVPSETGIGTSTLVWTGTGPANARARLVSTNNPTNFSFSTVAGGLQGFAMGVSNPVQAPTALTICSKTSFNATPTNLPTGTTYVWAAPVISPAGSIQGATAQSTAVASVSQLLTNPTSTAATATYTVYPSNNCSGLGYTFTVTVNPTLPVSVNNAAICAGTSATLTATGGGSYVWSTGATTATINPSTAGTYTVTVTGVNSCTASVNSTVTVNANPTTSVNSPTVCSGATATLTATGGGSYSWSTGASTAAITTTTAGAYTVTVTNAAGCTVTGSGTVTLNALPTPTVNSPTVCAGTTATATATGGGSYLWSTGATTAAISPATAGTYTVTVTGANTCTASVSSVVTINAKPTPTVNNSAICTGGTATLTATGGGSYSWSTGASSTAITTSTAGTYTVTVTAANTCTAAASGTVTVNANPTASVNSPTICAGSTATLTATGGGTYIWSTGATTASISATTAGSYTVTVTNASTCTATASGTVSVNPVPSATVSNSGAVCTGSVTVTITPVSGGPLSYSWSGPASFTSSASTFSVSTGGTYSVVITGSNSCTASASTSVSIGSCLTVSGSVFDDGNGNGSAGTSDSITDYNQTLYAIIADTNNLVLAKGLVAYNGAFSMSSVPPSTSGMTVRVSTTNPAVGASAPAPSWPTNWLGTLGQYGTNNLAGTGVYNDVSEIVPIKTGTINITGIMIGFDRLAPPVSQVYTIAHPAQNSIKALTAAAGLGNVVWSDPEDGSNTGSFVVTSIANMHNNILFYDSNSNNVVDTNETVKGYRVINNFVSSKLKMKFTGIGSSNAAFSFDYIDLAGKTNPTSSTYTVNWTGSALPVKLEYFTAEKKDDHSSLLKWATVSEINNDHFDVERSGDALQWDTIGRVQGAGNSNDLIEYSLIDDKPLSGTNYYRLKQVDVDGHFAYSDIAEVEFDGTQHSTAVMTIYPNPLPAGKPLNIALAGTSDGIRRVLITNALGQTVFKNEPSDEQGYKLTGLTLPTGTYIISVLSSSNETFSTKIVIQ